MIERGKPQSEKEALLKKFQDAAKVSGQAIQSLGLTEEDVLKRLEETRQQLYDERYGKSKN